MTTSWMKGTLRTMLYIYRITNLFLRAGREARKYQEYKDRHVNRKESIMELWSAEPCMKINSSVPCQRVKEVIDKDGRIDLS